MIKRMNKKGISAHGSEILITIIFLVIFTAGLFLYVGGVRSADEGSIETSSFSISASRDLLVFLRTPLPDGRPASEHIIEEYLNGDLVSGGTSTLQTSVRTFFDKYYGSNHIPWTLIVHEVNYENQSRSITNFNREALDATGGSGRSDTPRCGVVDVITVSSVNLPVRSERAKYLRIELGQCHGVV